MITISKDQLAYVLERKYPGIRVGSDVILEETTLPDTCSRGYISNKDAHIVKWNLNNIPQPSEEMLDKIWTFLEPQFHSDINQYESELFKYLNPKEFEANRITINEDL